MHKYKLYKMVEVNWQCEKCKKANMEFTGWVNDSAKFECHYEHKCPKCNKISMLMHKYPYLEYPNMVDKKQLKRLGIKK